MLRRTCANRLLKATPALRVWVADDGDATAPDTTFKNLKPGPLLRLWRQIRHRAWILWTWDEEWMGQVSESYMYTTRMEQICHVPTSSYGSTPGSYCDPILYNTKTTSPFRWHSNGNNFEVVGHWYMDMDEIQRLKDWQPKNPDDPFEMFPRPPRLTLAFDETVDEHGTRTFKYKYRYDLTDPHGGCFPAYPFSHLYGGGPEATDRVEPYGFKQGELLRADKEEEEVIRRIMEEEDREWERVKRTEIIQEPWTYPGKIRPQDLKGSVDRAKARWREQIRQGKPTDPTKDPDYDLVMAGEYVEPRDGPRAEWRHLWFSNRTGTPEEKKVGRDLQYRTTFNEGMSWEANEYNPEPYPGYKETVHGAEKFLKKSPSAAGEASGDAQVPPPASAEAAGIPEPPKQH